MITVILTVYLAALAATIIEDLRRVEFASSIRVLRS